MATHPDDLRTLYTENNIQFRFFLTWRQLLIAGYFAIFGAICAGLVWMLNNLPVLTFVAALLGVGVSVLFCLFDSRNRELYRVASKAGLEIEQQIGDPNLGYFYRYGKAEKCKTWGIRHERLLKVLYLGGAVLFFAAAVLCFLNKTIGIKMGTEEDRPSEIEVVEPIEIRILQQE